MKRAVRTPERDKAPDNAHDDLVAALTAAEAALAQSTPKASHYQEAVQRHADALASVRAALAKAGAV